MEPRASLEAQATTAFSALSRNPYPGRGLVIGRAAEDDAWLLVYWIMGRSAHSQNRRFVASGPELRTEPVDAAAVEDPSLIIYEAMLELPGCYLVTNGDQTRTLRDGLEKGESFETALRSRECEPDAPNLTPRISGLLDIRVGATVWLSLLRADPFDSERTARTTFELPAPPPGYRHPAASSPDPGSPPRRQWSAYPGSPCRRRRPRPDPPDPRPGCPGSHNFPPNQHNSSHAGRWTDTCRRSVHVAMP